MVNKILGVGVGTIVAVVFVLPLSIVRGLIAKIPVVGSPISGILNTVGTVGRMIPVIKTFY